LNYQNLFINKMYKGIIILFIAAAAFIAGCKNDDSSVTPTTSGSNKAPNVPSNPSPADNATNVGRFVTLLWQCSDPNQGDTLRYDVYAGPSNPPANLIAGAILNQTYDLGLVASQTKIFWKIVAKDNHGAYTDGPVWNFTTEN
jgi:hypothetical protein